LDEKRVARLVDVLRRIAASRGPFSIDGNSLPDGGYSIRTAPEISTFSDHIVASFPIPENLNGMPAELVMDIYLHRSQEIVSQEIVSHEIVGKIAAEALKIGLLVRGGLTIGKLYHSDGVAFGEAMVDAYRLESRVAIYPRIAVSSRIYAHIPTAERSRIMRDVDGIWHLDYFSNILENVESTEQNGWIGFSSE